MGWERKEKSFLDDIDRQDHHVVMTWELSQEKKKKLPSTVVSSHFFSTFYRSSLIASLFSSLYFDFSAKKAENKLYWKGEEKRKTKMER